jgi:hypothetical protein
MFDSNIPALLLYTARMSKRGVVTTHLVVAIAGLAGSKLVSHPASQGSLAGSWSSSRLAGLLDGELVGRSTLQGCSVRSWSVASPR